MFARRTTTSIISFHKIITTRSITMSGSGHKLKLYYSPGACSMAPHILLRDSGLPFEAIKNDVSKPWPEDRIKLNPKKQVPFLELEPGVILTEVPAIITAISQLVPEKKYLGDSSLDVLRSYEWFNYLSGQLHARRFGVLFRPFRFVNDEALHPMVKGMAKDAIREAFGIIEEKLQTCKPFDSAHLRAFEAYLYVFFRWGNAIGLDLEKDYPTYYARMMEVSKLEAVTKTAEAEGVPLYTHGVPK